MTWEELRWGLQLIAEEGIGRLIAASADREDQAYAATRKILGG